MINTKVDDVTRRGTVQLLAGLLAAVAVLGGCASKQEASQSLPSTSAAPSTKALPPLGPTDLPMPAAARTQDAAGAEAFVRYYIALINRTSTVMDAKPLRDFSQNCRDCNRIAANTEKDAQAGYHYKGGELTLTEIAPPLLKSNTAEMALGGRQAALAVVDASGHHVTGRGSAEYAGLSGGAALAWDPQRVSWAVTDLTIG
ncbi:MAG: DUF6318 family protein [Blastococcus sp.]